MPHARFPTEMESGLILSNFASRENLKNYRKRKERGEKRKQTNKQQSLLLLVDFFDFCISPKPKMILHPSTILLQIGGLFARQL